ncbi:MAG: transglutaminase N-terminal domain-containing protein, partial [Perlucidibaca sp.]
MARYQITHQTCYQYGHMVSLSQQLLHVEPRPLPWQRVLASSLHIQP